MPDDAIAKSLAMSDMALQRRLWLENVRENLPEIFANPDIRGMQNMFAGMPGIVVGAGPSLERNIDVLAAHARRYPLFCTDRAFKKLHDAGVIPQFTVCIDFQKEVADFFKELPTRKTILAASVKACPAALRLPWKQKLFFLVADTDDQFTEALLTLTQRRVMGLNAAIIVGNTAYLLARFAGCNPITFVGCDLSMPEPSPVPGDMNYEATGIHGNKIYSLPGYLSGLEWLLRHLRLDNDIVSGKVKVYNSTEGGIMYADVLPPMSLQEFASRHPGAGKSLNTLIAGKLGGA
jgi:hypothetical protein